MGIPAVRVRSGRAHRRSRRDRGRDGPIAERFGRFEVLCTLLLAGDALAAPRAAIAAELASLPVPARTDRMESANLLGDDALLVRMAAASVEDARRTIRARLRFLPALLGDDPWARRP